MALPIPDAVPKPGFYYHYKHNPERGVFDYAYEVVAVGFHTEDNPREGEAQFCVYRPLYEGAAVYQASGDLGIQCVDLRPLGMWLEQVEVNGNVVPRFSPITDETVIAQLKEARSRMYPQG
ncbi:MAG: hypothetical protein RL150_119 [Candidatus Parcubacteria bacterium]|jgi:hypothetical protein